MMGGSRLAGGGIEQVERAAKKAAGVHASCRASAPACPQTDSLDASPAATRGFNASSRAKALSSWRLALRPPELGWLAWLARWSPDATARLFPCLSPCPPAVAPLDASHRRKRMPRTNG